MSEETSSETHENSAFPSMMDPNESKSASEEEPGFHFLSKFLKRQVKLGPHEKIQSPLPTPRPSSDLETSMIGKEVIPPPPKFVMRTPVITVTTANNEMKEEGEGPRISGRTADSRPIESEGAAAEVALTTAEEDGVGNSEPEASKQRPSKAIIGQEAAFDAIDNFIRKNEPTAQSSRYWLSLEIPANLGINSPSQDRAREEKEPKVPERNVLKAKRSSNVQAQVISQKTIQVQTKSLPPPKTQEVIHTEDKDITVTTSLKGLDAIIHKYSAWLFVSHHPWLYLYAGPTRPKHSSFPTAALPPELGASDLRTLKLTRNDIFRNLWDHSLTLDDPLFNAQLAGAEDAFIWSILRTQWKTHLLQLSPDGIYQPTMTMTKALFELSYIILTPEDGEIFQTSCPYPPDRSRWPDRYQDLKSLIYQFINMKYIPKMFTSSPALEDYVLSLPSHEVPRFLNNYRLQRWDLTGAYSRKYLFKQILLSPRQEREFMRDIRSTFPTTSPFVADPYWSPMRLTRRGMRKKVRICFDPCLVPFNYKRFFIQLALRTESMYALDTGAWCGVYRSVPSHVLTRVLTFLDTGLSLTGTERGTQTKKCFNFPTINNKGSGVGAGDGLPTEQTDASSELDQQNKTTKEVEEEGTQRISTRTVGVQTYKRMRFNRRRRIEMDVV